MSGGQVAEMVVAGLMVVGFPIWDILTMGDLRRNSTHSRRMRLYRLISLVEWGAVALVWGLERAVRGGGLFFHLERNPLPNLAHGGSLNQGLLFGVGAGLLAGLATPVVLSRLSPALAAKTQAALKPILFLLPRGGQERFAFFLVALTAGICEEVLYRGFLLHVLVQDFGVSGVAAVGLAAVAFGVAHAYQGWLGALVTCAAGAGFVAVYCVTGSLLPGILIHALIDIRPLFLLPAESAFPEDAVHELAV